jgi:hypothetical protein
LNSKADLDDSIESVELLLKRRTTMEKKGGNRPLYLYPVESPTIYGGDE